jgi:tetratricopeptide (TPR) repeat protein
VLQDDALASVYEICRRLDGLPLAIELVAARLVVLPPAEIVRALESGLALDMEGPVDLPERQRTLRAAIDWSYSRLTPSQRALHGSLAVFSDGASLDDAAALSPDGGSFLPDLEALVGWSLVRSETADSTVRLSMLETVREHALERLAAAGALSEPRTRHADHFLALALAAEAELSGADRIPWLERLERELDNVRTAIEWLLEIGRTEDALRATAALSRFWRSHGHMTEARRLLAAGLQRADDVSPTIRADALWAAGRQAAAQSDWATAQSLLEDALPLFRAHGREQETAFTLSELAFLALRRNETQAAADLSEKALLVARELDDPRAVSAALVTLAEIRSRQGEHESALAHNEEAVALRRALGDPLLVTNALHNLGWVAFIAGDYVHAREAFEESLAGARELGDALHTAEALRMLGELDLFEGHADAAELRITESLAICTEMGSDLDRAASITALGGVAAVRGDAAEAARLFEEALTLRSGAAPEAPERAVLDRFYASRPTTSTTPE